MDNISNKRENCTEPNTFKTVRKYCEQLFAKNYATLDKMN